MNEKLSLRAKERIAKIMEGLTPEKKREIQISERIKSLLSEFYRGSLAPEDLWRRLREFSIQDKEYIAREIQLNLIETMSLGASEEEIQKRGEGILAVEVLKRKRNTSLIESNLNLIKSLQKKYRKEKENVYQSLKHEFEDNPELRVKTIKRGNTTMVVQLSAEEAVKQSPEWKNFVSEYERRYHQEFIKIIERLKEEAKGREQ